MVTWLFQNAHRWLAVLLGGMVVLIIAAFVLEYGFGVLPCKMCWWQRYVHWAVAGLAAIGLMLKHPKAILAVAFAIGAAALVGLYIACWQYAAQHGWLPWPPSCTGEGLALATTGTDLLATIGDTRVIPCDKETFTLLGLSLAGWNIPIMLGTALVAVMGGRGLANRSTIN